MFLKIDVAQLRTFFLRQRMKARAFCLNVRGITRLSIHQPLAFETF
jgi:hypothetical protein